MVSVVGVVDWPGTSLPPVRMCNSRAQQLQVGVCHGQNRVPHVSQQGDGERCPRRFS